MTSARPHVRTEQIGLTLVNHLAPAVTVALEHNERERALCDGFPARGESAGRGSSPSSSTEAAAAGSRHFAARAADIRTAIDIVDGAVKRLADLVYAARVPAAIDVVRCKEGQFGRDSVLWSDDTRCLELPNKARLCQRHYWQFYRYRLAHGIDVSGDFEESA